MTSDLFNASTLSADEALFLYNGSSVTKRRVVELSKQGYRFVAGNNPRLNKTDKWSDHFPIRVAQTNSRRHGFSIQTLWAVREAAHSFNY